MVTSTICLSRLFIKPWRVLVLPANAGLLLEPHGELDKPLLPLRGGSDGGRGQLGRGLGGGLGLHDLGRGLGGLDLRLGGRDWSVVLVDVSKSDVVSLDPIHEVSSVEPGHGLLSGLTEILIFLLFHGRRSVRVGESGRVGALEGLDQGLVEGCELRALLVVLLGQLQKVAADRFLRGEALEVDCGRDLTPVGVSIAARYLETGVVDALVAVTDLVTFADGFNAIRVGGLGAALGLGLRLGRRGDG